jgi:hypothetical protein
MNPFLPAKQEYMASSLRFVLLFLLLAVLARADDEGSNNNSTNMTTSRPNNSTTTLPPLDDDDNSTGSNWTGIVFGPEYYRYDQPPWGPTSYGNADQYGSDYPASQFVLDIVRPGWSWNSNRQQQLIAPFCYDTVPRGMSTCYTGQVQDNCQSVLQGTPAYGNRFCLTDQPHTIIGPVCWNRTCYGEETRQACASINGWFVGGKDANYGGQINETDSFTIESPDVGWCVVPGDNHTLFGPACYGEDCFTTELKAACTKLNGTNFADLYCLLPGTLFTVVGPVCTPRDSGPIAQASQCYGNETARVCQEMGGTNVGDIFCILNNTSEQEQYSVLGPFCHLARYDTGEEPGIIYGRCVSGQAGETSCQALSGQSIGNGTFCILNGSDYHLLGPTCGAGGGCAVIGVGAGDDNTCRSKFGGQPVGDFDCIIQGDYTIVGPSIWGNVQFWGDNVLADDMDETMIHDVVGGDASWYLLNGTYSVYGPACWSNICYDGDCVRAGGSSINSLFCVMKIDATSSNNNNNGSSSNAVSLVPTHTAVAVLTSCLVLVLQCFFLEY